MDAIAFVLADGAWSGWIWPLIQFIIGLGLVVFVHELGHFLVAKAVDIKVEKFALGFGPKLLGVTLGETEYSLRALPLGGYIKMVGQDDFRPRKEIAEEDPRSFNAKSVGARLAVISAGVVMNVLFALVLFVTVAMVGKDYTAPIVGSVKPLFPAAEAKITWTEGPATQPAATQPVTTVGLQPGDRIARVDGEGVILSILGNQVSHFQKLSLLSITADRDEKFALTLERDVDGKTWVGTTDLGVREGSSEMGGQRLSFGMSPAASRKVVPTLRYTTTPEVDPFQEGDEVLAVAGKPLRHAWELESLLAGAEGATVPVTVRRDGNDVLLTAPRVIQSKPNLIYLGDGTKLNADDYNLRFEKPDKEDADEQVVFEPLAGGEKMTHKRADVVRVASDGILDLLGMVPPLRVTGIVTGEPAESAKLQPGDVIAHYGDMPLPTIRQLRETSNKVGEAGNKTRISVERGGKRMDGIPISPEWDRRRKGAFIGVCRHVDLASTVVADVRPGSPAAKAEIKKGCVIEKINDRPVGSWLDVFDVLRTLQGQEVTLTYRESKQADPKTWKIASLDKAVFDPDDYEQTIFPGPQVGFNEVLQVTLRQKTLGGAMGWGLRETGAFMVSTYASISSLIKGTVSTKEVLGPVGMGGVAIQVARQNLVDLVWLMAYLSAILAVMNFLPLPVVDGGYAVFLLLEKLRGKPLPIKVMNAIQIAGLALILLLFVAITFQDISRFF